MEKYLDEVHGDVTRLSSLIGGVGLLLEEGSLTALDASFSIIETATAEVKDLVTKLDSINRPEGVK